MFLEVEKVGFFDTIQKGVIMDRFLRRKDQKHRYATAEIPKEMTKVGENSASDVVVRDVKRFKATNGAASSRGLDQSGLQGGICW